MPRSSACQGGHAQQQCLHYAKSWGSCMQRILRSSCVRSHYTVISYQTLLSARTGSTPDCPGSLHTLQMPMTFTGFQRHRVCPASLGDAWCRPCADSNGGPQSPSIWQTWQRYTGAVLVAGTRDLKSATVHSPRLQTRAQSREGFKLQGFRCMLSLLCTCQASCRLQPLDHPNRHIVHLRAAQGNCDMALAAKSASIFHTE